MNSFYVASPIPPGAVISALAFVLAANAVKEAVEDYVRSYSSFLS